jgi:large subunit ribosomal protein L11
MAKKVTDTVKLQIAAGKATQEPPVVPAIGTEQIKNQEFCKQFNAKTPRNSRPDHSGGGFGVPTARSLITKTRRRVC